MALPLLFSVKSAGFIQEARYDTFILLHGLNDTYDDISIIAVRLCQFMIVMNGVGERN